MPGRAKKSSNAAVKTLRQAARADLTSLVMVETVISIRAARLGDEAEIAAVHDAAWREAYRGVIPGPRARADDRAPRAGVVAPGDRAANAPVGARILRLGGRLRQLRAQPGAGAGLRRRDLRALPRAGMPGLRLRPAHVRRGAQGSRRPWAIEPSSSGRWPTTSGRSAFTAGSAGACLRRAQETFGGQQRERVAFGFG